MSPSAQNTSRQRGMTIVEMVAATALIFVIVIVTQSSIFAIQTVNQQGETVLRQEATSRDTLAKISDELALATLENDPSTNLPRYSIVADIDGNQVLRFQKLVGISLVDDEIEAIWSPYITIRVDDRQRVIRTEQGRNSVLGSGIKHLFFDATGGGFNVQCVTSTRDPKTGSTKDITHGIHVAPTN